MATAKKSASKAKKPAAKKPAVKKAAAKKPAAKKAAAKKPAAKKAVSLERFGVPAGMEPQLAFELDFRPLQPFLAMADAMIPPGPDGSSQLEKLGVVGKDPMVVRGLLANSATEGAAVLRLVNGAKAPEYKNLYSGTLKPADLQWLPVDARSASLSRTDFSRVYSQMLDQIETQMDAMGGGEDGFEEDSKGSMSRATARSAPPPFTTSTRAAVSARARRRCSTPARCTPS